MLSVISNVLPISSSFDKTAPRCFAFTFVIVKGDLVIAPAQRYVPASIRSAITLNSSILISSPAVPWIVNIAVPIPSILTPLSFKISHSWTTSGSLAALVIVVAPLARAAAITMFAVPVTVILSKIISQPFNPSGAVASTYPALMSMCAPICSSAFKCKSIGLCPIAQPPGSETSQCPNLANRGPSTKIEARIVLTMS